MMPATDVRRGGIVLCGGRSSRMGRPKHLLPWGRATVLDQIVETVRRVVGPLVVVGAPDQERPQLPDGVLYVQDEQAFLGPLSGLLTGLRTLGETVDAVYLTGCDTPLLTPEFLERVFCGLSPEVDVSVVVQDGFFHPLAAAYRVSLQPSIERLMEQGELRPRVLIQQHRFREITPVELQDVDPDLRSLRNMNTWEEYQELLRGHESNSL